MEQNRRPNLSTYTTYQNLTLGRASLLSFFVTDIVINLYSQRSYWEDNWGYEPRIEGDAWNEVMNMD